MSTDPFDDVTDLDTPAAAPTGWEPPPPGAPVKLSTSGLTIELSIPDMLQAMDPHGRYLGYDPDEDEDRYSPDSLSGQVVQAAALELVKQGRKTVLDLVAVAVRDQIAATVEGIVREHLGTEVQQVTEWGAVTGPAKPLGQLIGEQVEAALRKPETRDGYGSGRNQTMVQRVIANEVEKAFKVELQAHVKEAQTAAVAAVKSAAAEVIGESIDRARRGLL